MKNRLYLQLGRAGDIINMLPLLAHDFERNGAAPRILVAAPYRDLIDGVTYAVPHVFSGPFERVDEAWLLAEKIAEREDLSIVCTQIYGDGINAERTASSFSRQSWDQVPGAPPWGSLPLVFDRPDASRAVGVRSFLTQRTAGKPYVVLSLSGTSSPFEHGPELRRYLNAKIGREFAIVDVSAFLAPRFYDLVPLLAGAAAIVAVDSGLLHLAHAVPEVPVVAFITRDPTPWHGTAWRPQHVARFYYDEAPECFAAVVDAIARPAEPERIVHAWAHFGEPDDETKRRRAFAEATWVAENHLSGGRWVEARLPELGARTSVEIGDPRPVPFVRDVVDAAARQPFNDPADVVALTNADVCLAPGITGQILDHVRRRGAAFTHRWDFAGLSSPFRSESDVKRHGQWYPGSDAFFFTVGWWRRRREEFPDMLFGREGWDEVFRQLVKRHGGLEIHCAIYHERHPSFWEAPGVHEKNPGNVHNRRLRKKWFLRTGYGPGDPEWWRLPAPQT